MAAFDPLSTVKLTLLRQRTPSSPYENELLDIRFATLDRHQKFGEDNGYRPRQNRHPARPIKVWMAYFNMIRVGLGAGLLASPLAVSQVGIVLGPILIIVIGALFIHTHILLLHSLNEISRQLRIPVISYRYGFRMAVLRGPPCCRDLGEKGPVVIGIFMILSQLGICTVFVIFTSDNLRDIADWPTSKYALLLLFLPYLCLEMAMHNLKIVTYISMFGTVLFVLAAVMSIVKLFDDPHGEISNIHGDALSILFSNGIFLFNMSSIGVALVLEKALSNPYKMTEQPFGIIPVGITLSVLFSIVFGCLGYWSYGTMEENMLRSMAYDEPITMVIMFFYLLGVALAYPLQSVPGVSMIVEIIKYHDVDFQPSEETLETIGLLTRPIFVLASFIISYYIPFQGPFVAFVGNLCTSVLSLIGPALMDSCLRYPNDFGYKNWILYKNIFIILWGLTSFIFGVLLSSYLIYVRMVGLRSTN